MRMWTVTSLTCVLLLAACGDDRSGTGKGLDDTDEGISVDESDAAGEANDGAEANDSADTSEPNDTADGNDDDGNDNDGNDDSTGPKFDLGTVPDAGGVDNCAGEGDFDFSYIWVANSSQGTISKINTVTLVEEGRYRTRADNAGSPSRTSVNLTGDVAVANREGSITKVIAIHERCDEMHNGQPGLQTSTGKDDVLAWEQDDCVAWNTPMPGFNTQRPIAWTSGVLNNATCQVEDQFVWTAAAQHDVAGSTHVFRLNGEDGLIDTDLPIPEIGSGYFGPYGGAVDSENDFWFITYDTKQMVEVDFETLEYTVIPIAIQCPYGFTIDSQDRPWIGDFCNGSALYDPINQQWHTIPGITGYGLQEDNEGVMWLATFSPPGLRGIDVDTLQEIKWIQLPTGSSRGVSIDFEGYVWFVDMTNSAWKVDTNAETWEVYSGLNSPYTYSDMTGHGLNLVSGGIPQG